MNRAILCLIAVAVLPATVVAEKVGDKVVVIAETEAELKTDKGVISKIPRGEHLLIEKVSGQRFSVHYFGTTGWIDRKNVIHIDKAVDFFTEAIKKNPTASNFQSRALAWQSKSDRAKAIRDYGESIRIDPKRYSAYVNRGNLLRLQGKNEKAITDINEAIRLQPKKYLAYLVRTMIWRDKKEYSKAISDYTIMIRLRPQAASLNLIWRGNAWRAKGNYDKAIADYTEAIRREPKFSMPLNQLAWLQATCPDARFRDGKKAVANASKACELTKWKNADCLSTLAAAYAESGDFKSALEWQKKAIELAEEKNKKDYRQRLQLYQQKKPYREKK